MEKPTTLLELNILQIEEWNKSIKECALYMEYLEKKLKSLKDVRIQYVHELLDYSAKELKKFKGLGNRKVEVIEKALAEYSERSQLELFLISRGIELKLCGS